MCHIHDLCKIKGDFIRYDAYFHAYLSMGKDIVKAKTEISSNISRFEI